MIKLLMPAVLAQPNILKLLINTHLVSISLSLPIISISLILTLLIDHIKLKHKHFPFLHINDSKNGFFLICFTSGTVQLILRKEHYTILLNTTGKIQLGG